jgi:hypothetical protein
MNISLNGTTNFSCAFKWVILSHYQLLLENKNYKYIWKDILEFLDTEKVYIDVNDLKTFHRTLRLQTPRLISWVLRYIIHQN